MAKKPSPPSAPEKPVAKKAAKNKTGLTGQGGPGRGQGRKPGSRNKRTIYKELVQKTAQERYDKALAEGRIDDEGNERDENGRVLGPVYGKTPLEFMLGIMNDRRMPTGFRAGAAKDAAPYVHPKLANVTVKGDPNNPLRNENVNTTLTKEEFTKITKKVLKEI